MAVKLPGGLTNVNPRISSALNRKQSNDGLRIGHQIAPHAIVPAEKVDYLTSAAETDLVLEDIRAAGAKAKEVKYGEGSFDTLTIIERMLKVTLDPRVVNEWQVRGIDKVPQDLLRLRRDILDAEEYRIATKYFNAANFAADHKSSAVVFGDTGILAAFETAVEAILDDGGRAPRLLVLGRTAFKQLKENPDIKAAYKSGGGAQLIITLDMIREFLDVERVIVGRAARKIAGTTTRFWTEDSALLCAADFDQSPNSFILDDQTFAATAVLPYDDGETAQDGTEFFGVRQADIAGVEQLQEFAVGKRYNNVGLNWSLGYLWTNVDGV